MFDLFSELKRDILKNTYKEEIVLKISVVIATYNGSRFIREQFDSIVVQSRQPDEVVITDDVSSDGTKEIVEQYIADHHLEGKWFLHVNKKNKGYAKNFIDGAMHTTGDVIFFCDQDDIWNDQRIEKMIAILEKNPNINLLCSDLQLFYYEQDTRKWDKQMLQDMKTDESLEYCHPSNKNFHVRRSGCTMCIRRSYLNSIFAYWIEGWAHDDFVWKMAVASSSCAILHFASLKRRMHANNATVIRRRTREERIKQLYGYLDQYNSLNKYVLDQNLDSILLEIINRNIRSIGLRLKVVQKRYIWYWPILYLKYLNCYPRKKGVYLDLYLAILNVYKGAN